MSSNPYLILHKVRGEPAFDVAERTMIGSEEGWIISTSGHRAYPWKTWALEELMDTSDINSFGFHDRPANAIDSLPDDWPDHYPAPVPKRARTLERDARVSGAVAALKLLFTEEELADALSAAREQPKESEK